MESSTFEDFYARSSWFHLTEELFRHGRRKRGSWHKLENFHRQQPFLPKFEIRLINQSHGPVVLFFKYFKTLFLQLSMLLLFIPHPFSFSPSSDISMFSVSSAFNNSILKFEHLNPSCHTATALTDRDFQGKFRKSRKTGKIREKKKKILKCTVKEFCVFRG